MDRYPWIVFVHVAAAFLFVLGHGASMWVSDQIKRERDPARIRPLLELSSRSLGLSMVVADAAHRGDRGRHHGRLVRAGLYLGGDRGAHHDHRADVRVGIALLRSVREAVGLAPTRRPRTPPTRRPSQPTRSRPSWTLAGRTPSRWSASSGC